MPRRHRIRRVAKWFGAAMCTVVLILWIATGWVTAYYVFGGGRYALFISFGVIQLDSMGEPVPRNDRPPSTIYRTGHHWTLALRPLMPYFRYRGPAWDFRLPFWLLTPCCVIPTGVLFYLDRKRPPRGHCRSCGYNLTGNTSGRCPECGSAVEARTSEKSI